MNHVSQYTEHNEGRCELCYVLTKWTITYYNVESKIFMRSTNCTTRSYRHQAFARISSGSSRSWTIGACSFPWGCSKLIQAGAGTSAFEVNCGLFEFQRKGSRRIQEVDLLAQVERQLTRLMRIFCVLPLFYGKLVCDWVINSLIRSNSMIVIGMCVSHKR